MQINTYDGSMWASTPTAKRKFSAKARGVYFILSERVQRRASKIFRQRMCMCFLFSDDEFCATAQLSEESRIKNTYTDGTSYCAC